MRRAILAIFVFLQILFFCSCGRSSRTGLLIVAHGSSSPEWNRAVMDIRVQVSDRLSGKGGLPFRVETAFLETSPTIAEKIGEFEKQGIREVYIQPLFFVPSGHLSRDIPSVLDMYYEKGLSDDLRKEGIATVKNRMHFTMGPPLSYGNLVGEVMLSRAEAMSRNPSGEKLVLLSHGSGLYNAHWEKMVRDAGSYVCDKKGIKSFDYAFVRVGQDLVSRGLPAIRKGLSEGKRVLVAGIFLAQGARGILDSSIRDAKLLAEINSLVESGRLVFSEKGLLPDGRVAEWIEQRAMEYLGRFE